MRTTFKKCISYIREKNRLAVFVLSFLLLFSLGSYALAAALYHPGDTNNPACGPTDPDCFVDFLPDQTSNANKFLRTNGTTASWAAALAGTVSATQVPFGASSNTVTSSSDFFYDASQKIFSVGFNGSSALEIDRTNGLYKIGDIADVANGTTFFLDDSRQFSGINVASPGASFEVQNKYPLMAGTPVFSGTLGDLDDLTAGGTYDSLSPATIHVTITAIRLPVSTTVGFSVLDHVTDGSATGDVMSIVTSGTPGVLEIQYTGVGNFTGGGTLSNGFSTATISPLAGSIDEFAWTEGGGPASANTIITNGGQIVGTHGITITFASNHGHTNANTWDISLVPRDIFSLRASDASKIFSINDVGTATLNGDLSITGTGGGPCVINGGTGGIVCTSDKRLKTNIEDLSGSLDNIKKLRPVAYTWVNPKQPQDTNIGFLAQDVQEIFPQFVASVGNGYIGVSYAGLVTPAIAAIQELDLKVETLTSIDLAVDGSLASRVISFLKDAVISIKDATIGTLRIGESVCADDVCVTKEQFKQMLRAAGGTTVTPVTPVDPTPEPENPSPVVTETPAPEVPVSETPETPEVVE